MLKEYFYFGNLFRRIGGSNFRIGWKIKLQQRNERDFFLGCLLKVWYVFLGGNDFDKFIRSRILGMGKFFIMDYWIFMRMVLLIQLYFYVNSFLFIGILGYMDSFLVWESFNWYFLVFFLGGL